MRSDGSLLGIRTGRRTWQRRGVYAPREAWVSFGSVQNAIDIRFTWTRGGNIGGGTHAAGTYTPAASNASRSARGVTNGDWLGVRRTPADSGASCLDSRSDNPAWRPPGTSSSDEGVERRLTPLVHRSPSVLSPVTRWWTDGTDRLTRGAGPALNSQMGVGCIRERCSSRATSRLERLAGPQCNARSARWSWQIYWAGTNPGTGKSHWCCGDAIAWKRDPTRASRSPFPPRDRPAPAILPGWDRTIGPGLLWWVVLIKRSRPSPSSSRQRRVTRPVKIMFGAGRRAHHLVGVTKETARPESIYPGREKLGRWNALTCSLVQLWCGVGLELVGLTAIDPLSVQEKWRRLAEGRFGFIALYL